MYGGLGLVNLRKKQISLHVSWIKLIQENLGCKNLASYFLGRYVEDNTIWEFNLNSQDARKVFGNAGFWAHVINGWAEYHFQIPQNEENIRDQMIFMNSNIKCGNEIITPKPNFPTTLKIDELMKHKAFLM